MRVGAGPLSRWCASLFEAASIVAVVIRLLIVAAFPILTATFLMLLLARRAQRQDRGHEIDTGEQCAYPWDLQ
jgi:hypothetical protein